MSTAREHSRLPACLDHCVGTLFEWDPGSGVAGNSFKLYYNEVIYIGRDRRKCQYVVEDPVISNKHLRIYTIIFDHDNPQEVAPLVYAQDLSSNGTCWNNNWIGKGNGGVLLSDGDILTLSARFHLLFRCVTSKVDPFDRVQRMEMKSFETQYDITKRKLGSGAYGQVHMAIQKETGQQLACKIVDIRGLQKKLEDLEGQKAKLRNQSLRRPAAEVDDHAQMEEVKAWRRRQYQTRYIQKKLRVYDRETEILGKLRHPNIISLEKVIKTPNTIYIFQDLITAGDLFSFLEYKGGKLCDIEAAVIVRQILMALEYLHERNIVHRDLKPDNILMTSLADGCRVVLTDFGCAKVVHPNHKRMMTLMGTFEYAAPEVIQRSSSCKRGYTKAVDLWSLGCVTVVLLTGGSPFMDPETCFYSEKLARECNLEKLEVDEDWIGVGERPKDFVYHLLVLDENTRMDVRQALKHSWFTNSAHMSEFEHLYERAIKDWKPRPFNTPMLLEYHPLRKRWETPNQRGSTKQAKQHVPVDPPYKPYPHRLDGILYPKARCSPSGRSTSTISNPESSSIMGWTLKNHANPSPTLSDVDLPELNRTKKGAASAELNSTRKQHKCNATKILDDPKGLGIITTRLRSHVRLPFSPEAWIQKMGCIISPEDQESKEEPLSQVSPSKIWTSGVSNDAPMAARTVKDPMSHRRLAPKPFHSRHCLGKKRPMSSIYDLEEDQVYEVENTLSGERHQVIYGTDIVTGVKKVKQTNSDSENDLLI